MPITTLEDLRPLLPNLIVDPAEWHLPCPFCSPDPNEKPTLNKDGIPFYGEDRLFIRMHDLSLYCRRCGRHTMGQLASILGSQITPQLETIIRTAAPAEKKPLQLLSTQVITGAMAMVDRNYWKKFGWGDDTIKRFKLGRHVMYQADGFAHVIPMQPQTVDTPPTQGWMLEGRVFPQPAKRRIPTKRTYGSSGEYFWHVRDNLADNTVVLVEGAKDGVSAWVIGFKNFAVSFGTGVWYDSKTDYLKKAGYTRLIVAGDNDVAGSNFSTKVVAYAQSIGLAAYTLHWEPTFKEGYDLTNLLEDRGIKGAMQYIDEHISKNATPIETRAAYVSQVDTLDPNYKPVPKDDVLTLDEIRGEGPRSISASVRTFLKDYKKRKRGDGGILLLKAPPGSGKSYTLIKVAQEVAKKTYDKKRHEKQRLGAQIAQERQRLDEEDFEEGETAELLGDMILRMENKYEQFSMASVMWLSQFKVSYEDIINHGDNVTWDGYWYDYKARNADNCVELPIVNAMAEANHNIGEYCATVCPFREKCLQNGYLSQDRERRKYPITVFRHQHIGADWWSDYPDLIVIDESPLHVMQQPLLVKTNHLYAHNDGWGMNVVDTRQIEYIELLANGIRQAMMSNKDVHNPDSIISGAAFLNLIDMSIKGASNSKWGLENLFPQVDLEVIESDYQPNQRDSKIKHVKHRVLHDVYRAIANEFPAWVKDKNNKSPSQLHLIGQTLEVHAKEILKIPKKNPIIIADATASMPQLYEKVLDRPIDVTYEPKVLNPNAVTTIYTGSDNTVSRVTANMGKLITMNEKAKQSLPAKVTDVVGDELDLSLIDWVDSRYNNKLFDYYVSVIDYLTTIHESLLVISAKNVRVLIEDYLKGTKPDYIDRIQFNHFGNVRGTNIYRNIQSVLLIGQFRIPYNVLWREIQSWANLLGITEEIPMTYTYKTKGYHSRPDGHSYRTFTHPFAQDYVDGMEEAEMEQAAERIRPHATSDNKFVYLLASRPTLRWVTNVSTEKNLKDLVLQDSTQRQLMEGLKARFLSGKPITQQIAIEEYGATTNSYKKARAAIEVELGIKLPKGRPKSC